MTFRSLLALTVVLAACDAPLAPPSSTLRATDALARAATSTTGYAIIANAAVTCTDGTIDGDVATAQAAPTGSVTLTTCPVTGTVHVGDAAGIAAYEGFVATYAALAPTAETECTLLTGTLADVSLAPGTYCFDAAAALTGTLTLDGPSTGSWLFYVGTSGTGALTGTNFTVLMADDASACNVTWWVAEAVTMTTSNFVGTILAGAAITLTGGTFDGNAWSHADVTVTGTAVTGCDRPSIPGTPTIGSGCNQGVGNGPEGCDPGRSNHRRPSNDETGGMPGAPGRRGGR